MASIPESSKTVRLALAGVGRWGRVYLRTLAALEGVALAAVASGNPETAALAPPGCPVFPHWQDLLAAGGFDGLIIASPPARHAEIAEAALRRGYGVLVEKPLTLDLAEARGLGRAAADYPSSVVRVGHIHLSSPAWHGLKRHAALLGPIQGIRSTAGNHGPYRHDASVLWDWGPHDLSMCLDLLGGMPDRVGCRRLSLHEVEMGRAERLELRLGFGPVETEITLGNDMDKTRRFEVICAGGRVVYDDLAKDKLTVNGQAQVIAADPPLTLQTRDFAAAIRTGCGDRSSLELGIRVVDVLERCQAGLS